MTEQIAKATINDEYVGLPRSQGYVSSIVKNGGSFESAYFNVPLYNQVKNGNLWQGGCLNGFKPTHHFEYIISLYKKERYDIDSSTTTYFEFEMIDSTSQDLSEVEGIASLAHSCVKRGPTLIHCQAGLNRSGLVAGRVLMLDGLSAGEAITTLRESRGSSLVLCNPRFEQYLWSMDK